MNCLRALVIAAIAVTVVAPLAAHDQYHVVGVITKRVGDTPEDLTAVFIRIVPPIKNDGKDDK